jgi:hypothetical protein
MLSTNSQLQLVANIRQGVPLRRTFELQLIVLCAESTGITSRLSYESRLCITTITITTITTTRYCACEHNIVSTAALVLGQHHYFAMRAYHLRQLTQESELLGIDRVRHTEQYDAHSQWHSSLIHNVY